MLNSPPARVEDLPAQVGHLAIEHDRLRASERTSTRTPVRSIVREDRHERQLELAIDRLELVA